MNATQELTELLLALEAGDQLAAKFIGVSQATVEGEGRMARAWLRREMEPNHNKCREYRQLQLGESTVLVP